MKEKLSKPQEGLGDDDDTPRVEEKPIPAKSDNNFVATKTLFYKVRMTEDEWKKNGIIELLIEIGDMINELFDDPYRFGTAEILTHGLQDEEEISQLGDVERR